MQLPIEITNIFLYSFYDDDEWFFSSIMDIWLHNDYKQITHYEKRKPTSLRHVHTQVSFIINIQQ